MNAFSLPWSSVECAAWDCPYLSIISSPLSCFNTQSKKIYACYASDIPFRGSSWPHWQLINCPECTIAAWTNFPHQDPQILPAAVFFVLWKMIPPHQAGWAQLYLHPPRCASAFKCRLSPELRRARFLRRVGQGCVGALLCPFWVLVGCIWNPQSACGYLLSWFSIGLGQSLLCINKGHFIDCLFIPCLLYYDPTQYFQ